MLAEDNLPDALLIRKAIKSEDLPIWIYNAPDGEDALDFVQRAEDDPASPCPDFMLLDINLPKVDGFEVLRRLRASGKWQHIPVLVITSSDSQADRSDAARLGASYFRKPVNYEEFLKIGGVLKEFLRTNQLL